MSDYKRNECLAFKRYKLMALEEIIAKEKKEEETAPFIDFSKTEEYADDYDTRKKSVKKSFIEQLISKLAEIFFGVVCVIATPMAGPIGSILFMAAIFYFFPDGIIKGIVLIHRLRHYEDYVTHKETRINQNFVRVVMNAMGNKWFISKKNND